MNPARLRLAGHILDLYANGQVARNCDDFEWPAWFPVDERHQLVLDVEKFSDSTAEDTADAVAQYTRGKWAPPVRSLARYFSFAIVHLR